MNTHRFESLFLLALVLGGCMCGGSLLHSQPVLVLHAAKTDFGAVTVGKSGLPLTVTLENAGQAAFTPTAILLDGAPDFAMTPTGDLPVLQAGATATLTVTFSPTKAGAHAGTLKATCPGCDAATLVFTGSGIETGDCKLGSTASSLIFTPQAAGASQTLLVPLSDSGTASCVVTFAIDQGSDTVFTVDASAASLIPVGQTGNASVTFTAPSAGKSDFQGTLIVNSNDLKNPQLRIPLTASTLVDTGYAHSPWPKWHANGANTGRTYVDTTAGTGKLVWSAKIGAAAGAYVCDNCGGESATYLASPAIAADGTIYQAGFGSNPSKAAYLRALDPVAGNEKWRYELTPLEPTSSHSTPTVAADGSLLVTAGGDFVSAPIWDNTGDEFFHLSSTGSRIASWRNGSDGYDSNPSIAPDGTIYVMEDDAKRVLAFKNDLAIWNADACNTTMAGQVQCPGQLDSGMPETFGGAFDADGRSYWAGNGSVWGLAANGVQMWSRQALGAESLTKSAPALATVTIPGGRCGNANPAQLVVFVAEVFSPDGGASLGIGLYALDPASGADVGHGASVPQTGFGGLDLAGKKALHLGVSSPSVLANGDVVVGHTDGLHAFGWRGNCEVSSPLSEQWHFASGNVVSSPAVSAEGTIYFGSADGNLYAVKSDGTLKWSHRIGAQVNSSPAIGADGTIYVTADDGYLYAVR